MVIFHSDIYGSGQPHADTDASTNRIIFAPLMDEFDIDVCLTGHDHTYSRSYQVLDGNVVDYDISSGTVADPEGTMYITTGENRKPGKTDRFRNPETLANSSIIK